MTTTQTDKAKRFLELHRPRRPLLMPNAWDLGSAALLASLGFEALATTSSGHAATLGRLDGGVTRDEALGACLRARPGHRPAGVGRPRERVRRRPRRRGRDGWPRGAGRARRVLGRGLLGRRRPDLRPRPRRASGSRPPSRPHTRGRSSRAHGRAENHIRGRDDLADTIARLQAYQEAGADVLFAPGLQAPRTSARSSSPSSGRSTCSRSPGPRASPSWRRSASPGSRSAGRSRSRRWRRCVDAAQELREQGPTATWSGRPPAPRRLGSAFAD